MRDTKKLIYCQYAVLNRAYIAKLSMLPTYVSCQGLLMMAMMKTTMIIAVVYKLNKFHVFAKSKSFPSPSPPPEKITRLILYCSM